MYHESQCRYLLLSFLDFSLHVINLFLQLSLLAKQRVLLSRLVQLGFRLPPPQGTHLHLASARHLVKRQVLGWLFSGLQSVDDGLSFLFLVDAIDDVLHVVPALADDGGNLQLRVDHFLQNKFEEVNPLLLDRLQLVQDEAELPVVVVLLVPVGLDELLGVNSSVVLVLSSPRLTEDRKKLNIFRKLE